MFANSRKTNFSPHPGLSACHQTSLPTHFCLPGWAGQQFPPLFFSRIIENNPSKKRKRANKMMKRYWRQLGGGRESVGVNARMRKREKLPFKNKKELINNPD